VYNIVADESIIGQDGKKKIKIPVRGIKEYRFVYGDNNTNKKAGTAPGADIRRGQKIGDSKQDPSSEGSDRAGTEPGEEYYDVEITLEELAHYLFDDLELPDMEKKALKKTLAEKNKRKGYRTEGIKPRLDKKRSAIERIKRKNASQRAEQVEREDDRFPFHENDLVYRHYKKSNKISSNAVIFFVMDISGSMTKNKKFLARTFYFLLYHFIRSKYEHTEIVFVAHDTTGKEVNEEQFFTRGNSGGTLVSSGLSLVYDIINSRYHPQHWNVYCFQCSDGDNWPEDTSKTLVLAEQIKNVSQLFGYCEIVPQPEQKGWFDEDHKLSIIYQRITGKKMKCVTINDKTDIWMAFSQLFGGKKYALGSDY